MNLNVIIITILSFSIIYWIQHSDKNNRKNERKITFFDKLKLPVLVISLIGIVNLLNSRKQKTIINFSGSIPKISQTIYTEQPDF